MVVLLVGVRQEHDSSLMCGLVSAMACFNSLVCGLVSATACFSSLMCGLVSATACCRFVVEWVRGVVLSSRLF
jgi:hypothetical protein